MKSRYQQRRDDLLAAIERLPDGGSDEELAEAVGISRASVANLLYRLMREQVVFRFKTGSQRLLTVNPDPPKKTSRAARKMKPSENVHRNVANRRCLVCGFMFESEWIGERVCGQCKNTSRYRYGESRYG